MEDKTKMTQEEKKDLLVQLGLGDDGEPTGRYLVEVHGRLPFLDH